MTLRLHCAAFMAALLAFFFLGKLASRRKSVAVAFAVVAGAWLAAGVLLTKRQDAAVRLAKAIPIGDGILLLQVWFALPVTFLLAALSPWLSRDRDRRAVTVFNGFVLCGACLPCAWLLTWPFSDLSPTPPGGTCLQTANYSCGAASAVNFLRLAGLDGTEEEMARACGVLPLRGVTMAGAWWGVEKKLRAAGRSAALLRLPFEALIASPPPVMVAIRHNILMDHMVVLSAVEGDCARILDPSRGEVLWTLRHLRDVWLGEAIALVPPSPAPTPPAAGGPR